MHKYFNRTKELSKLNSPWSSPSKFPASQTRYPYFSTGLTSDSRYRSFLLFLSFPTLTPSYTSLILQT